MSNYDKLKKVLEEIFQIDRSDLDFGIYRIMNRKRTEINTFLTERLPVEIKDTLTESVSETKKRVEEELKTLARQLDELGVVKEDNPKYRSLKAKADASGNLSVLEQECFSHLANFFRRYYQEGDFISMRRYKKDTYAIPYEGEEVKLHWANNDQYYIKTSENFKNYTFKTENGLTIHFRLKEAGTEQNNNKEKAGEERRFQLYDATPVEVENDELYINFTYEPVGKLDQKKIIDAAYTLIENRIRKDFGAFDAALAPKPTDADKNRTLLRKHLNDYVAKNTFDYFIHKDLGGFLTRELDFYIKNEILNVDDWGTENEDEIVTQIAKIKALKKTAGHIIRFLTQIEDFQKKLWLKKKFVMKAGYCITLDRIPEKYYPEIVANKAQLDEWKSLFNAEISSESDLMFEPYLVLDTQFFSEDFKDRLLAEFHNLDEQTDGLLINSENFQALNLLQEKYKDKVKSNYIDPPYNSDASKIAYKNDYEHSSWLSLMQDRVLLSRNLLSENGILQVAIDDIEFSRLEQMLKQTYGASNYIGNIAIMNNPKGRDAQHLASSHEYTILVGKDISNSKSNRLKLSAKEIEKKYPKLSDGRRYRELPLRRSGSGASRTDRPYMYFPFVLKGNSLGMIEEVEYKRIYANNKFNDLFVDELKLKYQKDGSTLIFPIRDDGSRGRWRWGFESCMSGCKNGVLFSKGNTIYQIDYADETYLPKSLWYGETHDSSSKGTNLLSKILPKNSFNYPKSLPTVMDFLTITSDENSTILDYFGGSATTGHATIKLNREDGGKRKYILVEMGAYFNTVTKPRIQKVIYTDSWKNGKPQDKKGVSQMFKYFSLESYEDTLNNLQLPERQTGELDFGDAVQREYLLSYMLDVESRDQLLNLEMFRNPFAYELKVTENNELIPTQVDLPETFNYLIGLYVKTRQRIRGILHIEGETRTGEKTLVLWRNVDEVDNAALEAYVDKLKINVADREFDRIYVNGDHTLTNRMEASGVKIKLIEEEFFNRMFEER